MTLLFDHRFRQFEQWVISILSIHSRYLRHLLLLYMTLFTLPQTRDDQEPLISLSSSSPTSDSRSTAPSSTPTCPLSIESLHIQSEFTLLPLPVCKKKALLIGIQNYNYQSDGEDNPAKNTATVGNGQIKGPHADVQHMRQLLLGEAFRRYHSQHLSLDRFFFPFGQIVMDTPQMISLCLLTMVIGRMCNRQKRTS